MMMTPGASAISALLGAPATGEAATAGPAGLFEPFASFLATATLSGAGLEPAPLPSAEVPLGELLALPLSLAGEQPPALESLSALLKAAGDENGEQPVPEAAPDTEAVPDPAVSLGAEAGPAVPAPATPEAGVPLAPPTAREPGVRAVPGIAFPVEASASAAAPDATPLPIVEPVAPATPAAPQPAAPPNGQVAPTQIPVPQPAAASAGPPVDGPAAQQAGPLPTSDSREAPEPPRPVAPGVGLDGAPALGRATGGQPAGPAPALMDATIQRIVAIAEQSAGTTQRAMVVELPDTDGARLLVSMRGEAVHVTVASQGSGLPGQSWLSELATALTTRGFVPEGLLADGNGGRRSPYQPQDDPPPPPSSDPRPRRNQPEGLSL